MKDDLKFTVILPTRERADVLSASLKTVVMQDYGNLEIIVSDNLSNDNTRDVVDSFHDSRIKYFNTESRLSMSHNWEFALSHAKSGWLTILGDDDGLLPGSISKVAELAAEYKVDAIRSSIGSYLWPSVTETKYGRLSISTRRGGELRDTRSWLSKVMGGWESSASLPMLYTGGFVNRELINRALGSNGAFYQSMIPDVYSAVAFSRIINSYYFSHEPLALGGASSHSNGVSSFKIKGNSSTGDTPAGKFLSEANIPFHTDLPTTPDGFHLRSNQLIVYESYLQSSHLSVNIDPQINHKRQLELIVSNSKRYMREETKNWAILFANKHDIKIENSMFSSLRAISPYSILRKRLERLRKKIYTKTINGSNGLPLRDIHEGCIAASTILQMAK